MTTTARTTRGQPPVDEGSVLCGQPLQPEWGGDHGDLGDDAGPEMKQVVPGHLAGELPPLAGRVDGCDAIGYE